MLPYCDNQFSVFLTELLQTNSLESLSTLNSMSEPKNGAASVETCSLN